MAVAAAKMTLSGDRALRNLFQELPKRIVKKGLRQSMNAAIEPMRRDARQRAKQDAESGLLARSIAKKIKTYKSGNVAAILGANRSVEGTYHGRRRVPANYIALVEKGTQPHAIGRGTHPGTRPRPFLEDAYKAQAGRAVDVATAKLTDVLENEAAKLAAR